MHAPALRDLPAAALAEAADANFAVHASWLQGRHPHMAVLGGEDLLIVDSGLPCDTFNLVLRARLAAEQAGARVAAAVDHFRHAGRPFSWWLGPADQPPDLADILAAAGLERSESELAMAADLAVLPPLEAPARLAIERVRSAEQLRAFAAISAANWTPPDPLVVRFYELVRAPLLEPDCPLWLYVGFADGVPVATAEMAAGGGVAGLYNIATLAAQRRRGYGTALALRPLLDAREQGFRTAVLQAAAHGVRIYERLGFRRFGDITEFKPAT